MLPPSSGSRGVRHAAWALAALLALGSLLGARAGAETVVASTTPEASSPPQPLTAGQPLPGLAPGELAAFEHGRGAFERERSVGSGLGPVFNDIACNRCHNRKGVGGAGIQSAVQVGRYDGTSFDTLVARGGPLLAANTVMGESAEARSMLPRCKLSRDGEPVPSEANVVARRRTTPLFGLGLVDATPDAAFEALAERQPAAIRGRVARVQNLKTGQRAAGKFGWKAQAPSLHQFSGQALLLELGVTSPEFPSEQPPFGDGAWLADCDVVADPEDDGGDVARMTDFMRLLAPVARLEPSAEARAGDALFSRVGCDGCHVRALRSGPSPVAALSEQSYAPYSDFLLHDMGALGDGVVEGDAGPREMRTAPLWGLRLMSASRLLHDGRARSLGDAIERHDGQGAAASRAFRALSEPERQKLVAFLETL